jgi:hypothetical protein
MARAHIDETGADSGPVPRPFARRSRPSRRSSPWRFGPETKGVREELEDHFRHYEFTGPLPRGGRSG